MSGMTPLLKDWIGHIKKVHPPKAGTPIMPEPSCTKCQDFDVLNQLDYDLAKE